MTRTPARINASTGPVDQLELAPWRVPRAAEWAAQGILASAGAPGSGERPPAQREPEVRRSPPELEDRPASLEQEAAPGPAISGVTGASGAPVRAPIKAVVRMDSAM